MDLEASAISFSLEDASISTAVGSRIYADKIPDNPDYPFVKISQVDSTPSYTHSGKFTRVALLQFDVCSKSKSECNTSAALFTSLFSGYKGQMGDVAVGRCFVRDVRGEWSEEGRHFRRILEMEFGINE